MEDIIKEMRSIASRPWTETTGRLPMWGILTLRRCWAGVSVCMCFEMIRYKHFCILDVRVCTHIYFYMINTCIYLCICYRHSIDQVIAEHSYYSFPTCPNWRVTGRLRGESPKRSQQQTVISWHLGVKSLNRGTSTDGSQPTPLKINMDHNSLEVWFRSFSFPNGWFVGSSR